MRCSSTDYEVPLRDRVGRKKISRRRGGADQTSRVEAPGGARMTDVRAVRPAVTHPEYPGLADWERRGIRGLGHDAPDVRRVADNAHTGRLLPKLGRTGGEA